LLHPADIQSIAKVPCPLNVLKTQADKDAYCTSKLNLNSPYPKAYCAPCPHKTTCKIINDKEFKDAKPTIKDVQCLLYGLMLQADSAKPTTDITTETHLCWNGAMHITSTLHQFMEMNPDSYKNFEEEYTKSMTQNQKENKSKQEVKPIEPKIAKPQVAPHSANKNAKPQEYKKEPFNKGKVENLDDVDDEFLEDDEEDLSKYTIKKPDSFKPKTTEPYKSDRPYEKREPRSYSNDKKPYDSRGRFEGKSRYGDDNRGNSFENNGYRGKSFDDNRGRFNDDNKGRFNDNYKRRYNDDSRGKFNDRSGADEGRSFDKRPSKYGYEKKFDNKPDYKRYGDDDKFGDRRKPDRFGGNKYGDKKYDFTDDIEPTSDKKDYKKPRQDGKKFLFCEQDNVQKEEGENKSKPYNVGKPQPKFVKPAETKAPSKPAESEKKSTRVPLSLKKK
jgi:hypothetical protein